MIYSRGLRYVYIIHQNDTLLWTHVEQLAEARDCCL